MDAFWWIGSGLCILAVAFIVVPMLRGTGDSRRSQIGLAFAVAVVIPLAAFLLYDFVGAPHASAMDSASATVPKLTTQSMTRPKVSAPPVSELADKLARRLEGAPDDPEGWALLAQSYNHLGMNDKAQDAYERAVQLGYDGARLSEKIQKAGPGGAMTELRIAGELMLSESAADAVEKSDTVFVVARAPGSSRLPVAVQRRTAADFPLQFVLSDADVMMAGSSLGDFEQLEISARVSKSGMAEPSSEDLRAAAQTVAVRGGESVRLVIDRN